MYYIDSCRDCLLDTGLVSSRACLTIKHQNQSSSLPNRWSDKKLDRNGSSLSSQRSGAATTSRRRAHSALSTNGSSIPCRFFGIASTRHPGQESPFSLWSAKTADTRLVSALQWRGCGASWTVSRPKRRWPTCKRATRRHVGGRGHRHRERGVMTGIRRSISYAERKGADKEYPILREHLDFIIDGIRHMPDPGKLIEPLGWFALGIAGTAAVEAYNSSPGTTPSALLRDRWSRSRDPRGRLPVLRYKYWARRAASMRSGSRNTCSTCTRRST